MCAGQEGRRRDKYYLPYSELFELGNYSIFTGSVSPLSLPQISQRFFMASLGAGVEL